MRYKIDFGNLATGKSGFENVLKKNAAWRVRSVAFEVGGFADD